MRIFLVWAVATLAGVPAIWAGDGLTPRGSSSDYPVHRDLQGVTIAAAPVPPDVVKKMFPAEVNGKFAVVEVAVFPLEGQTVEVDWFDFGLKFPSGEVSHPRAPEEIVSLWMEHGAPKPPDKVALTAETGVVYQSGNDPATGRTHGWGTYTGVAVGPGQPAPPPRPPSADPDAVETNLRAKALPERATVQPVAGYLYFPLPSKKRKSGELELQYTKDGEHASLTIPNK